MTARDILDAVDAWASDRWMLIREIGACVDGRLDGLLIPSSFEAMRADKQCGIWTDKMHLFGIEVKASRSDYLAGLKRGQFEKYMNGGIAGLFIATGREIKTREIPDGIGHLVVRYPDPVRESASCRELKIYPGREQTFRAAKPTCACRRMPTIRREPMTEETCWRVVFRVIQIFKEREKQSRVKVERQNEVMGSLLAEEIRRLREAV